MSQNGKKGENQGIENGGQRNAPEAPMSIYEVHIGWGIKPLDISRPPGGTEPLRT